MVMKMEATVIGAQATENESDARRGNSVAAIRKSILDHIHFSQARLPVMATPNDWYVALAYTVRDRMFGHWINVVQAIADPRRKIVGYLSAEFLMGPHLGNALISLGIYDNVRAAVAQLGLDLDDLLAQEEEPGLGNGGLGRLAACYMDSLAALGVPALGYGIRYEFGIFSQEIRDGWQVEKTDKWLRLGNPWEIHRPELSCTVNFGGRTEWFHDERGRLRIKWIPNRVIKGVPYDTPIPAFRKDFIGILRLWKSEAVESFDFQAFNVGDYYKAVDEKVVSETVSKVLYPNDEPEIGKSLLSKIKSQGVKSLDDSAMVMRVKFKSIPGEQFIIQREVYRLLQEKFHKAGIEFAHRNVTVYFPPEMTQGGKTQASPETSTPGGIDPKLANAGAAAAMKVLQDEEEALARLAEEDTSKKEK